MTSSYGFTFDSSIVKGSVIELKDYFLKVMARDVFPHRMNYKIWKQISVAFSNDELRPIPPELQYDDCRSAAWLSAVPPEDSILVGAQKVVFEKCLTAAWKLQHKPSHLSFNSSATQFGESLPLLHNCMLLGGAFKQSTTFNRSKLCLYTL